MHLEPLAPVGVAIDHVLVGPELAPLGFATVERASSDHVPVAADVAWR